MIKIFIVRTKFIYFFRNIFQVNVLIYYFQQQKVEPYSIKFEPKSRIPIFYFRKNIFGVDIEINSVCFGILYYFIRIVCCINKYNFTF